MRHPVRRKNDPLGIQSASTIQNGVFTNPQAKSSLNKRNRSNDRDQTHLKEEYPLSLGGFPTSKNRIARELSHSKRKSSITYLNKHNLAATHRPPDNRTQSQNKTRNRQINLQRSLSKRHYFDMISGSGSDINPRRLTPSSGETLIDSNSDEGEDDHINLQEINRSNSFHNRRLGNHSTDRQTQGRHVDRSNSKYGRNREEIMRFRRRQIEQDLIAQNVSNS